SHIHPEKPVSTVLHHQVANRYWSRTVGGEANRGQTQRNNPGSKSRRRRKQLRSLLLGLYPHRYGTRTFGSGHAAAVIGARIIRFFSSLGLSLARAIRLHELHGPSWR